MADVSRNEVKSRIISIVEPSISQIAADVVESYARNSPELAKVRAMDSYNFQPYSISVNTYIDLNARNSFIWGKSTWGIDSVGVDKIIIEGEYDPTTRSGVMKRDEFRPQ